MAKRHYSADSARNPHPMLLNGTAASGDTPPAAASDETPSRANRIDRAKQSKQPARAMTGLSPHAPLTSINLVIRS